MTTQLQALQQAKEALEAYADKKNWNHLGNGVLRVWVAPDASGFERAESALAALATVSDAQPVAVVDENDEGLFAEILYGEDGSSLKRGDNLYASPAPDVRPSVPAPQMLTFDNGMQLPIVRDGDGFKIHPDYLEVSMTDDTKTLAAYRTLIHTHHPEPDGSEFGFCRVKFDERGQLVSALWAGHEEIDAAVAALLSTQPAVAVQEPVAANAGSPPICNDDTFMAALDGYMDAVTNEQRNTERRIKQRLAIFAAADAWCASYPQAAQPQEYAMTDNERRAFERFDKPEWAACSNMFLRVLLSVCHETITRCGAKIENLQDALAAAQAAPPVPDDTLPAFIAYVKRLYTGNPKDHQDWAAFEAGFNAATVAQAHKSEQPQEAGQVRELPPPNSLPTWSECAMRVDNSNFIAKRVAEGGYGAEADSLPASALHRFICEYDDADPHRSAWFMHRLELVLKEAAQAAPSVPDGWQLVPKDHNYAPNVFDKMVLAVRRAMTNPGFNEPGDIEAAREWNGNTTNLVRAIIAAATKHQELFPDGFPSRAAAPAPSVSADATLLREIKALAEMGVSSGLMADDYCSQIAGMVDGAKVVSADAKDGVRYRWLRDKSEPGICSFYLSVGQAFKDVKFARETVDEAIDAATAAQPKEPKGAGE